MERPRVSVIVTCYNYAKYLEGCLTSILNQTYQDFELLIVNDGSTDNTDEIVTRFLDNDKIRYINQSNTGQAIATNNGITAAAGELIAFLDADDLWEPTKLQKQVNLFSRDSIGVVYSRLKFINEDGVPRYAEIANKYFIPRSGFITGFLLFENFIPYSSTVVRKQCFDKYGMFNPEYKNGLDWDLWLRISKEFEFAFVDEPLLLYRMGHPGQLTSNMERSVHCSDLIFTRFIENNPGLISDKLLREALAYSYCSRGRRLRNVDRRESTRYFLKALTKNPTEIGAYKGLLRNILNM
ncbi:MAG: glycosyltransferase family 2 protein [Dissulfurispiraceae bacterium]|jgi:glycosyltransferase involved in cell wall biosynthesis